MEESWYEKIMDYARLIVMLTIWMAGVPVILSQSISGDSVAREYQRDDRIFKGNDYYYWDKGGRVEVDLRMPSDSLSVFESVLKLETIDGDHFNLVLSSRPGSSPEFLWIHDSEVFRYAPSGNLPSDSLGIVFTFQGNKASLHLPDTVFQLPAQSLRSDQGYRIRILSDKGSVIGLGGVRGWRHLSDREERSGSSTWFWISIVVLADALFFIIVQYRRKYQRKQQKREMETKTVEIDRHSTVHFPRHNAVYLFGELRVLDKDGEEVSCKFSPLLRELFLILLIKTPEGGISSKSLTELLWIDKDEVSAKNNRSVNLHKLRGLLANVGGCRVERVNSMWQILFEPDTYVDYYECLSEKVQPDKLSADRIRILSAMTVKGGLLPSCDYLWLDKYKNRMSDSLIGCLLKYASLLGEHELPDTKLQVCDIVFSFDSTNEFALRLKCLTFISMNKQYMAKRTYEHFCRIYSELYGEPFDKSYSNIISL